MLDSIVNSAEGPGTVGSYGIKDLRAKIETTPLISNGFKNFLLQSIDDSQENIIEFRSRIEQWYDKSNERISGIYKRKAQWNILFLSLVITVALNADSVAFLRFFTNNPEQAQSVATLAERVTNDSLIIEKIENIKTQSNESDQELTPDEFSKIVSNIKSENIEYLKILEETKIPLGWNKSDLGYPSDFYSWLTKVLGLLITVLAVSLGAPFWFDTLNKLTNLRSSGNLKASQKGKG